MSEFDGSPVLNWWKKGSSCDAVGGQDGGTLYPGDDDDDDDNDNDDYNDDDAGTKEGDDLQMFISLMCRKIALSFEKKTEHMGLESLRLRTFLISHQILLLYKIF